MPAALIPTVRGSASHLGDLAQDGRLRHRLLPLPLLLVFGEQPTLLRLNPALSGSRLPHRMGERNNLPGLDTERTGLRYHCSSHTIWASQLSSEPQFTHL